MKKFIFFILLSGIFSANAQSLKDALYGGKLKLDSNSVIRKGDDLSTKIDTAVRKKAEPEKMKPTPAVRDSMGVVVPVAVDSAVSNTVATEQGSAENKEAASTAVAAGPKDNNKVWKDYMDELTGTLRTEVMTSKKIKGGTYSVLIEYEIGLDGTITVNSVSSSPENSFLEQQIKERITLGAPTLTPLLNAYGKPRKAIKKQSLTLAK